MKYINIVMILIVMGCDKTKSNANFASKTATSYSISDAFEIGSSKENDQKEITVKGISWGVNEVMSGDIILNLNDSSQGKDQIAQFICVFPSHEKDFVKTAKNNTTVTVKGKLRKTKYHVSLHECKILSMEFPD
jgi:hypothetical protein